MPQTVNVETENLFICIVKSYHLGCTGIYVNGRFLGEEGIEVWLEDILLPLHKKQFNLYVHKYIDRGDYYNMEWPLNFITDDWKRVKNVV